MMNEHSLRLLEFDRIRSSAAGYCLSEEGGEHLAASLPSSDSDGVRALKASVETVLHGLGELGLPATAFPPVAKTISRLSKPGSVLELEELYAVGTWAASFGAFVSFMRACDAAARRAGRLETPAVPLVAALERAPSLEEPARIVFRLVTKDGELRDLPGLRESKDRITRAHREIDALAGSYFRDQEMRQSLQNQEPTLRDGRTVLAVRANCKGRVKGIVHEVSSTGQTVFIEPFDLVEKNNALVEEEARYRAEVRKALRETTERLSGHAQELSDALPVMIELDGICARARHARQGKLVLARHRERGFDLRGARHPLLGPKAIPIDVELPPTVDTLVITGPNTGGKTVTLKTIGLFALMNQFGLGIPASPESAFAVFDSVFADIGDEQSIDQSLSTFSGHMQVIGGIVREATSRSLVLLDELGSGTDPEEGCAIAMSLLDFFVSTGCLTILTTHHGILKNYGYSRENCLNASMDFDRSSLEPTYRILMGVPGESRALDIAVRNGLPEGIVRGAAGYLSDERTDVAGLIRSLNEKHRKLEDLETERKRRVREAMDHQRKADLATLRNRMKELELRERGVSDLRRLLAESRRTLENLVREVRESGVTTDRTKAVKEFLSELAEAASGQELRLEEERRVIASDSAVAAEPGTGPGHPEREIRDGIRPRPAGFEQGDAVLVGDRRREGTLVRRIDAGAWLVQVGAVRLRVEERELAPGRTTNARAPEYHVELAPREDGGTARAVLELDIRGMRLVEALAAVERQVNAAALQNLDSFSIVHGTGEGVLSRGIHEHLRANPAVASFSFANPDEGGFGKTNVRLA